MTKTYGRALREFDAAFFGHVSFTLSNVVSSFVYGVTGGAFITKPRAAYAPLHVYHRAATRMSTAFALLADVSMFVLGGDLKRRERISARLGDMLSQLYLISATLKRFEDEGRQQEDLPLVRWGAGAWRIRCTARSKRSTAPCARQLSEPARRGPRARAHVPVWTASP